jgi:hypothetical protein
MKSSTLADELVTQIRMINPAASPEEIFESIADILGKEILPEVLKNISLPRFPSYRVEIAERQKIKERRRGETLSPADINPSRKIIKEIESVRIEMGWDGIDDVTPKFRVNNSTALSYVPKVSLLSLKEKEPKKTDIKKDFEEKQEETVHSNAQIVQIQPEKDIISLSETAQRKIASEPIFEEMFKNLEIELRESITRKKSKTELDVACKPDFEIPTWNKCVLTIHPNSEIDFGERMNISTRFDSIIRRTITQMKKDADVGTQEYLQNINDNFFVHVDL